MHRKYRESQKSVDFLNEAMKSTKYRANVKIFKNKIMDKGLHKEPPDNLSLNKIATTLDSETLQDDDTTEERVVHSITRAENHYIPDTDQPNQVTPRPRTPRPRRQDSNRTSNQDSLSVSPDHLTPLPMTHLLCFIQNATTLNVKHAKSGDTAVTMFLMSQVFWVMEFIKLYPRFCCTIADQYSVFHSRW